MALVIVMWAAASLLLQKQRATTASYPLSRTVQYSFNVKNNQAMAIENARFSAFAPVARNATQRVVKIKSSHPYEIEVDKFNNQLLHFTFDRLAPFETKVVKIRVELVHANVANEYGLAQAELFLQNEKFIQSKNELIVKKAKSLRRETDHDSVKAIYQFSANRINYKGYIKQDLGALHALKTREGDCTEYSALVVALARALGFPSRIVAGYVYPGNATLRPRDFHNWAEVYFAGRWHIVDAQYQRFVENQSHFVAMRVVAFEENKSGSSHQLVYASDQLNVEMN